MAIQQLDDGRWCCYYRDPKTKKTRREYFGRGAMGMAEALARNDALGLSAGKRGRRPERGITFAKLAESYVEARRSGPRDSLRYRLRNIIPALGGKVAMTLGDRDLDMYVSLRLETVRPSSVHRELTDIKAILNWAVSRKPPLIPWNPVRDYRKIQPEDDIIDPPTAAEIARLLAVMPAHLQRAVSLAYYVGARPGAVELLSLTWSAVDWRTGRIRITSAQKGGPPMRWVPVHTAFLPTLKSWHREDNPQTDAAPIVHYRGKQIRSFKTAWKNARKAAGITRRLRPYDLRHHFVTHALAAGADIKALSEIVGSSPATLRRHYQHITAALHRDAVSKVPEMPAADNQAAPRPANVIPFTKRPGR